MSPFFSVSAQTRTPAIFPPVTFLLSHGGHRRQQPPQLHILEQDGETLTPCHKQLQLDAPSDRFPYPPMMISVRVITGTFA